MRFCYVLARLIEETPRTTVIHRHMVGCSGTVMRRLSIASGLRCVEHRGRGHANEYFVTDAALAWAKRHVPLQRHRKRKSIIELKLQHYYARQRKLAMCRSDSPPDQKELHGPRLLTDSHR